MSTVSDIFINRSIPYTDTRPGWIQVDCPWCGSGSGKMHLGISLSTGASTCWRCGKHNTAHALALLTGESRGKMRGLLDDASMVVAPVRKTGTLAVPKGVAPMGPGHRAYLAGRGFDPDEVARLWGVQGIANAGKMAWRLYIPIHHHGEVVSWTTRSVKPREPQRWVSAGYEEEAIHHKNILYGADYCRHAIIVHEGPTDVWATGPGAAATCGVGYTEAQLKAMARYAVRVICFDNGPAAQRRARVLADLLAPFPGTTHSVQLETGEDPATAELAELAELRARFLDA